MINRILESRNIILASAMAGLLFAGCNTTDTNPGDRPVETVKGPQTTGESGILPEPSIPSAAEVKAMDAMYAKPVSQMALPAGIAAPAALAKSSAADVNVGFNDFGSLSQIKDHAYVGFADAYFQWVTSNAYAVVVPMEYGHYHLGYENLNDCFVGSNGFLPAGHYGVLSNGVCVDKGDAATQYRNLSPHDAVQNIQFYVYDRVKIRTFDFKSFYLPQPPNGDTRYGHVQIWINKVGVGWRYWADLPPSATGGYTWNLPHTGIGGAQGINEVRITSPNHTGGYGWTIDNLMVNNVLP